MKFLSTILATLVLFLTVQPVLVNISVTAEQDKQAAINCCFDKQKAPKHKNQQKSDKGNCCGNGHCNNPFLSCANCFFMNRDNSCFFMADLPGLNKKTRLVNDMSLSSFTQDLWHPPEAA